MALTRNWALPPSPSQEKVPKKSSFADADYPNPSHIAITPKNFVNLLIESSVRTYMLRSIFLILLFLIPLNLPADQPTTPTLVGPYGEVIKIGFVDVGTVMERSRTVRDILGEVDTQLEQRSRTIEQLRLRVARLEQSLSRQASVLSQEEFNRRQDEALELINRLDEETFRFDRELRQHDTLTIEPLIREINRLIGEVGQRDKIDLILRGEVVIYGSRATDLTPLIINEIDARGEEFKRLIRSDRQSQTPPSEQETPAPAPATESIPLIP